MTQFSRLLALTLLSFPCLLPALANAADADPHPQIGIETSVGNIVVELDANKAPATVTNILRYVDEGFYDGTIFHRVIRNFMIQGGGFTADYQKKPTHPPIQNEADNGLKNLRGTVAMARTSNPHSATAQFFINTVDNPHLDFHGTSQPTWGYAVFGRVVSGMEVVEQINGLPTGSGGPFRRDVPRQQVIINKVKRLTTP